ncbi:unnamed protein product, partial [Prorocentrum cordatum]
SPVASGPLRRLSLWLCRSHPSRGHVRQSALRFGAAPALQGRGHRDGDDQLSASQLRARHGVQDERQAWGQRRHQPGHHRRRAGRGRHRRGGRVQDGQSELSSVCEGRLLSVTSSPPAPLRHHPFFSPAVQIPVLAPPAFVLPPEQGNSSHGISDSLRKRFALTLERPEAGIHPDASYCTHASMVFGFAHYLLLIRSV